MQTFTPPRRIRLSLARGSNLERYVSRGRRQVAIVRIDTAKGCCVRTRPREIDACGGPVGISVCTGECEIDLCFGGLLGIA